MPSPKIPNNEHLEHTCRMGRGAECCVFLAMSPGEGFTCERGGGFHAMIEARRRSGTMVADSINCTGAPNFHPSEELPCPHCGMVMEFIDNKCTICGIDAQP